MIKARAEKKSNFEKTKTMTKQQRKTYRNSKKKNNLNSFKPFVENGTITQVQADKLGLGYHHHGSSSNNHM